MLGKNACVHTRVCTCIHMCTHDMCNIIINTFLSTAIVAQSMPFIGDTQEQVTEQDEDSDDVPGSHKIRYFKEHSSWRCWWSLHLAV